MLQKYVPLKLVGKNFAYEKLAMATKNQKTMKKNKQKKKEQRLFRRYITKNLWAKEFCGDFYYVLPVGNLSEGGMFLKGKIKTTNTPSKVVLNLAGNSLDIQALPVHDAVADKITGGRASNKSGHKSDRIQRGTGYSFIGVTPNQAKMIRQYLRSSH